MFVVFATIPCLHLTKAGIPSLQLCPFFISRCATMPYSPSRESKFFHLCSNVFSSFRKIKYSNKATRASQDLKSNSQENVRFSDSFWLEPQAHNLPFFDTPIACHVLLSETGASRGASHRSLRLSRLAARGQRFTRHLTHTDRVTCHVLLPEASAS